MLWQKLLGSNGVATPQGPAIQYVGGYVQGFEGTTANVTISLTSLTGGLASAPASDDLVIVYFGTGSTLNRNLVVAGYTVVADLYSDDTYDTNLEVAYKFMGASPDTSITLTGGTLATSDAGTIAIQVFRGVNAYNITSATSTGTNGGQPNPPAITPTAEGSVVVAGGASGHAGGTLTFTSSDLTDFITVGANDNVDSTVGMGYHQWLSGAFDPAQFGGGTTSTSASWAACALAMSPPDNTPGFVSFSFNQNTDNASSLTLARPASVQAGDLLVAFVLSNTGVTLAAPAGWTQRLATSTELLATKVVTASEPSSYSFSYTGGGDAGDANSGSILCFRRFNFDRFSGAASTGVSPTFDGSYVLGFPASTSASISYSQASFFEDTKLVVDENNFDPSFTIFGKSGVSSGATGEIVFTPGDTSASLLSLKPAPTGPAITVIATNASTNAGTSLTVPAHSAGDWLVVMRGTQSATPPTLLSGYTNLGTITADTSIGDRAARIQYIVSDGTITSISTSYYQSVAVIRGASSVGQSAFRDSTVTSSASTRTLPALTGLATGVGNLVLGGSYTAAETTSSNYDVLPNFGLQILGPTPSDISDATVSYSANLFNIAFAIEFLP